MANVTINVLYDKLVQVEREVRELRGALVPIESVSEKEHGELDEIFKEMKRGKATPWRKAIKG